VQPSILNPVEVWGDSSALAWIDEPFVDLHRVLLVDLLRVDSQNFLTPSIDLTETPGDVIL
jgi:hypothetical protein